MNDASAPLVTSDAIVTPDAIRQELRFRLARAGSQKELAQEIGMSACYLYSILNGGRPPGNKILHYLGLQKQTIYARIAE